MAEANADALSLSPPDALPSHDVQWLKIASEYEEATGVPVVNPRVLQPQSLYDVDTDWLHSMVLWRKWVRYYKDYNKRPLDMR